MRNHMNKKRWLILSSMVFYIIGALIFWWSWNWDIGLPYIELWLLLPALLIIKDIYVYTIQIRPIEHRHILRDKVDKDREEKTISVWYPITLANRVYVFPVIITVYLIYVIIQQTGLRQLDYSIWFLAWNEDILLLFVMASGVATLFGEERDLKYARRYRSMYTSRMYVLLSMILWILWGYIVLQEALALGVLWVVVANLAAIAIFWWWTWLIFHDMGMVRDSDI